MRAEGSTAAAAVAVIGTLFWACQYPQFSGEEIKKLEDAVGSAMAAEGIPGVIVGVWAPGKGTFVRAFGTSDLSTGAPMKVSDVVRIGGITKTFTATVVLKLADEKKLSLDDPLERYAPGVVNGSAITTRQLLNMTSGIFSFTEDADFAAAFETDPLMKLTPEQEVEISQRHEPDFAPGNGWRRSETNYALLGMIIRKVTGNDPGAEIRKRILDRLALSKTSYPADPSMPQGSSKGYVPDGESQAPRELSTVEPSVLNAAGCMLSNLFDLRLHVQFLAEGVYVSKAMKAEMMKFVPVPGGEAADEGYGLGIMRYGRMLGHAGAIPGFGAAMFHDPGSDTDIIVLANLSTGGSNVAGEIFRNIYCVVFSDDLPGACSGAAQ